MKKIVFLSLCFLILLGSFRLTAANDKTSAKEKIGVRPYEMDWAGRDKDDFPPLVDFESMQSWKCEGNGVVATFTQSREEQLFGKYVAKLTYRQTQAGTKLNVRPPEPIPVPSTSFDAMSCWIYGNNWAWVTDPKTSRVAVAALFRTAQGKELVVPLTNVRWKEWFLCHWRFTQEQQAELGEKINGKTACFDGFQISNIYNKEDRVIYFDNFAIFKEVFKPLQLSVRPKRGIDMFPGQSSGLNTGTGRLPFPTREDTILPDSAAKGSRNTAQQNGKSFDLVYSGTDGKLTLQYTPMTGTWSDLKAKWNDSEWFEPLAGGGINELALPQRLTEPIKTRTQLETKLNGNTIVTRWTLAGEKEKTTVEYRMELRGKSLILDTFCQGGKAVAVEFGKVTPIVNPRVFLIPYYSYGGRIRPKAIVFNVNGTADPLFILAHVDWYRSNGSNLTGAVESGKDFAQTNGKVEYNCKTDDTRNDVYERFFITITPDFDETLPTIANPISPWKHITGKKVWRAYGASLNRENDKKFWKSVWRNGMRQIIVTDHETGWRDGGESFTFRTRPAPKKGGDKGQYDYSRFMQDTLGFTYGPYNNFTDFAPVNGFWNYDMVNRTTTNQLQHAWARCYGPKPSKSVEYCEKLTPINQKKFRFSTAYCDVHTAVTPWSRTDYDARVPGGGTFAATYYPYGEIMLLQKKNWNGPVYSEGPHHCFYSGLTDGNYAQDGGYYFPDEPWLVNFDLLKIHDHECNFGIGMPSMYDRKLKGRQFTHEQWIEYLDRFIACTLAYGHPGFLAIDRGTEGALLSYAMVQQIACHYTQCSVKSIQYLDDTGKAHSVSAALANDSIIKNNQLVVRYADGTFVAVNGNNMSKPMKLTVKLPTLAADREKTELRECQLSIPANGYVAHTSDYKVVVQALCQEGNRYDYCDSPEYIFLNGRGTYQELPKAAGAGMAICRIEGNGKFEVIPRDNVECGFAIDADKATALTFEESELGPAKLRRVGPYVFVQPVNGAFSYRLEKTQPPVDAKTKPDSGSIQKQDSNTKAGTNAHVSIRLGSNRRHVVAGEKVVAFDRDNPQRTFELTIDSKAKPSQFVWFEPVKNSFINFHVVPMTRKEISLANGTDLQVVATSQLPSGSPDIVISTELNGKNIPALASTTGQARFSIPVPVSDKPEQLKLVFTSGSLQETAMLDTQIINDLFTFPTQLTGQELVDSGRAAYQVAIRGQSPTNTLATYRASVSPLSTMSCGGEQKIGWFMHPPYVGGTGSVCLNLKLTVPSIMAIKPVFRVFVGKRDGSDLGDGITFKIALIENGKEKILAQKTVKDHAWYPLEVSLAEYVGKEIVLSFITDVGPGNNSSGDWACWGNPRIESDGKIFFRTLKNSTRYTNTTPSTY